MRGVGALNPLRDLDTRGLLLPLLLLLFLLLFLHLLLVLVVGGEGGACVSARVGGEGGACVSARVSVLAL